MPTSQSPSPSLPLRLEKLRFLIEELQLAQALARYAPDSAAARMFSRHILVRAENFIEHTATLRKPLNVAGFKTTEFAGIKGNYQSTFLEYFAEPRHRLGAHLQDLDFAHRIEIWTDIGEETVDYFVAGALEIYILLYRLGIPDCLPPAVLPELHDPAVVRALQAIASSSGPRRVEIATDPLALTRPGTMAMINTTPMHARAGQISLLRRWIAAQSQVLERVSAFQRIARILKARLVTDVVSLYDALVTRPAASGAPQEMKGLDVLIRDAGFSTAPLDRFLANSRFDIQPVRALRDSVGAHLEGDPAVALADVLRPLDVASTNELLRFATTLEAVFLQLCRGIISLRAHLADGQTVRDVLVASTNKVVPFDAKRPDPTPQAPPPPRFDEATFSAKLTDWLRGDVERQADARSYFHGAFGHAPVEERLVLTEELGPSTRFHHLELRTVHNFLQRSLDAARDDETVRGIAALLANCASSWPIELAEVLVRYRERGGDRATDAVLSALGKLAPWWHVRARTVLNGALDSGSADSVIARITLFEMFVRDDGLSRLNAQRGKWDYPALRAQLLDGLSGERTLLVALALLSRFSTPTLSAFAKAFGAERTALVDTIEHGLTRRFASGEIDGAQTLRQLAEAGRTATLALWLASQCPPLVADKVTEALPHWVSSGLIAVGSGDVEERSLAICLLKSGQGDAAVTLASALAARNPGDLDLQLVAVEVLASLPERRTEARVALADLRVRYHLTAEAALRAKRVEQALTTEG